MNSNEFVMDVDGVEYKMLPADYEAIYKRDADGNPLHAKAPRLWHGVSKNGGGRTGIFATFVERNNGTSMLSFKTHRIME